ncbi:MAG: hypothetical protein FWD73_13475 [Polyangiaceae bacterium]|nr:hypothetical protein [Polyangiaceae bacterium]
MRRRLVVAGVLAGVIVMLIAIVLARRQPPFPGDHTPEGAYARIARSVVLRDPAAFFAYLETEAQWACFSIRDMRSKASAKVSASYPEPQRTAMLEQYNAIVSAQDGSDVFAILYEQRGWSKRLRKDLSGVAKVEIEKDRASVITTRGTRWPFRRRDNGIWGLTIFTAELLAESEKAARDLDVVTAAAADYDRTRNSK